MQFVRKHFNSVNSTDIYMNNMNSSLAKKAGLYSIDNNSRDELETEKKEYVDSSKDCNSIN